MWEWCEVTGIADWQIGRLGERVERPNKAFCCSIRYIYQHATDDPQPKILSRASNFEPKYPPRSMLGRTTDSALRSTVADSSIVASRPVCCWYDHLSYLTARRDQEF